MYMQKTRNMVMDINDIEYNKYIENALDEADKQAEDSNTRYLTHKEVFEKLRRKLNEWQIQDKIFAVILWRSR